MTKTAATLLAAFSVLNLSGMAPSLVALSLVALPSAACSNPGKRSAPAEGAREMRPGQPTGQISIRDLPDVDTQLLLTHTKILSSDAYEGRGPGTAGEKLAVSYLVDQLRTMGLKPGSADGTYLQAVPLVGITPRPASLVFRKGIRERRLKWKDDVVAWTKRVVERAYLDRSELVFVGHGVVAPEYNWDDYKDVDVRGKTLVVLPNDPPVPSPTNLAELDPKTFGGRAMTYYGRWTYKYEIGAQKGAAGVLIVHETEAAGYPFDVVQSKVAEQLDLIVPDRNMGRTAVEGWIALGEARNLFEMAGLNLDALKRAAARPDFRPVPLGVTASVTLENKLRTFDSHNVIATLEGSDPFLKDECVVYTAHWDHLGTSPSSSGGEVYHGARDNAAGTAALLELARAFTRLQVAPRRSIVFLSVTGEEHGLLGSRYYTGSPIYPLTKTLANINVDGLNVNGRTKDFTVIGYGASDLDEYVRDAVIEQGRRVRGDPAPEQGLAYRSDHFSFVSAGVPALHSDGGTEFVGKPGDYGQEVRSKYTRHDYHKPTDIVRADWDLSGAREDLQVLLAVGYRVAQASRYPAWRLGNENRARRYDASISSAAGK